MFEANDNQENDWVNNLQKSSEYKITSLYVIVRFPEKATSELFDTAMTIRKVREDLINYLNYN